MMSDFNDPGRVSFCTMKSLMKDNVGPSGILYIYVLLSY